VIERGEPHTFGLGGERRYHGHGERGKEVGPF
jgi:hypothetical protein